jgi:Spy/CpxP family protein refolding chaperone
MDPLAQKFHGQLAELGASMEEKKGLLMDLLQKEGDPLRIEELRKEMASIQDEIQKGVILHIAEIKKILDPRQQEQFFNLMRQSMTHGGSPWSHTNGGK